MKYPGKKTIIIAILALAALAAWQLARRPGETIEYRSAELKRGELMVSINATGTVEPEEVIDVGAQVAGRIIAFGKDANGQPVDYGSPVAAGTVLARIDDSLYAAQVDEAQAQLMANRAGLEKARAELLKAELDWRRAQDLGPSEALAKSSYDSYQAAYQNARAQVAVSEAAIRQAEAALAKARRNLGYCTISSPVKGIIIDRRVNIGQTVVASLNAPSLFLLAKDLKRIQVWVAVNEADIGRLKPGMPVSFTVDAFPNESFRGEVKKIRLNAAMNQNVVTYTVEIATDNKDGRLLPYLTANVIFEIEKLDGALQAPNAALRWSPPAEDGEKKGGEKKYGEKGRKDKAGKNGKKTGTLWVLAENNKPRKIEVNLGATDGANTVVEGPELGEGLKVITGIIQPEKKKGNGGANPFTPKISGGAKSGRGEQAK